MKISPTRSILTLAMALSFPGLAAAADPPDTAEVLGKLHQSNQKEIEMGKLAQKNGQSKAVKAYGKTLVKDHTMADKKVTALAKKEKLTLTPAAAKEDHSDMAAKGPDFDKKFSESMLDDHKKDVAEAKTARDATKDDQLKTLLDGIVPTLEKHEEMAQKLVDGQK
jgi:putative membrane protein